MKPSSIVVLLALTSPALANKADDLFKTAKKLMAEKKYAEACPKFEESYRLEPGIGVEINIGKCYEDWGKLGKAYHAYTDAERKAKAANDERASKIRGLVQKLEPQVPRLVIHIPPGSNTKGLTVAIDGVTVGKNELDDPQLVDPGPKQIVYSIDGAPTKTKLVPVERGGTSDVTLELPRLEADPVAGSDDRSPKQPPPPEVAEPEVPDTTGHGQRVAGTVVASIGVVTIGVSAYLGLAARKKYNDALSAHCMGMTDACDAQGLADTHAARSSANTATILFGVGAAATITGILVYIIAPKAASSPERAVYVVPTVSSEGVGFAVGGRY
ncbi:hypothetical protein BH11MYX1_BH11MYX1_44440 [soil metagenome]